MKHHLALPCLTCLAASVSVATGWGFTVDDALISARMAHHLNVGIGYRFNASGPIVDAVTPLGWAHLLAPFAAAGPLAALRAARVIGVSSFLVAAAYLGVLLGRHGVRGRGRLVLVGLAGCLPLGAWSAAGMETGLVMALATLGLSTGYGGALSLGMAAALRPELAPWALVLSSARAVLGGERGRAVLRRATLVLGPFLVVAGLRWIVFGYPAPLAVFAKPAAADDGIAYALGALLLSGPSYFVVSRQLRSLPPELLAILFAALAHLIVLWGVGGDWMPLWRLWVPLLPGLLLVGGVIAEHSPLRTQLARLALVLAASGLVHFGLGSDSRAVWQRRVDFIEAARPSLSQVDSVATLDVGWVGAAHPGTVVDLAGVTDERVAFLPGGHTSKQLPGDFLERRRVDSLVLLTSAGESERLEQDASLRWTELGLARAVEQRAARLDGAEQFRLTTVIDGGATRRYLVLTRAAPSTGQP